MRPILLTDSNGNGSLDVGDTAVLNTSGTRAAGSVYFTSYNDQTVGLDTNPFVTTPANGDWGGIEFRSDVDRTQGYFQWADEGIFLNYVNHADIRYGGGSVLINSVSTDHQSDPHHRRPADDHLQHDLAQCGCVHVRQSGQL